MSDGPREQNFQITLPDDLAGGVWANFATVSHSPYEFTIDFVRLDFARTRGTETPGHVVARVNLSPLMVTELMDALDGNWKRYADRALPPEAGPRGADGSEDSDGAVGSDGSDGSDD